MHRRILSLISGLLLAILLSWVPFVVAAATPTEAQRLQAAYDQPNHEAVVAAVRREAELDNKLAQRELGSYLVADAGSDLVEGVAWWRKAADQGEANAELFLLLAYRGDKNLGHLEPVYQQYLKRAEQNKRDAVARVNLGLMAQYGRGTSKDMAAAVRWYEAAATLGSGRAMTYLGRIYEFAGGDALPANPQLAKSWYQRAATAGHPHGMTNLATLLPNSDPMRLEWLRRSAAADYVQGETGYGVALRDGEGTKTEPAKALEWFRKAANKFYPDAYIALARMYEDGLVVAMSPKTAWQHYEEAGAFQRIGYGNEAVVLGFGRLIALHGYDNGQPELVESVMGYVIEIRDQPGETVPILVNFLANRSMSYEEANFCQQQLFTLARQNPGRAWALRPKCQQLSEQGWATLDDVFPAPLPMKQAKLNVLFTEQLFAELDKTRTDAANLARMREDLSNAKLALEHVERNARRENRQWVEEQLAYYLNDYQGPRYDCQRPTAGSADEWNAQSDRFIDCLNEHALELNRILDGVDDRLLVLLNDSQRNQLEHRLTELYQQASARMQSDYQDYKNIDVVVLDDDEEADDGPGFLDILAEGMSEMVRQMNR